MRLRNCKIENFGKLSNCTFDFSEGYYELCQPNGWGKSTLLAFIKVMFYGFANPNVRDDWKNERKRFKPWQGGVYGGQLTFAMGEKEYVICRAFGTKEKEDTFEVRDGKTNLPVDTYSEKIGEELFQLDRESFEKTVFLSQNDCETVATDGINAKLGNLAEHTDDMLNFESAIRRLTDKINGMHPRRKTGSLWKMRTQIGELEQKVRSGEMLDRAIENLEQRERALNKQAEELDAQRKQLAETRKRLGKEQERQGKRTRYKQLREEVERREKQVDQLRQAFQQRIPSRQDVAWMQEQLEDIQEQWANEKNNQLTVEEEQELQQYQDRFGALEVSEEQVTTWMQWQNRVPYQMQKIQEAERELALLQEKTREVQEEGAKRQKTTQKQWIGLGIGSGVVLAVCVLLACLCPRLTGWMLAAGALELGVAAWYAWKKIGKPNRNSEPMQTMRSQMATLENIVREEQGKLQKEQQKLAAFLQACGIQWEEATAAEELYQLREQIARGERLRLRQDAQRQAMDEHGSEKRWRELYKALAQCGSAEGLEPTRVAPTRAWTNLQGLQVRYQQYENSKEAYEEAKQQAEAYAKAYPYVAESVPQERLEAEFRQLEADVEEVENGCQTCREEQLKCRQELQRTREERQQMLDEEQQLEQMKADYEIAHCKFKRLEQTKALLEEAKESFTAKYMEPIMNGFSKYYGILTGKEQQGFHIDANTQLTVEEYGLQREIRFLSAGWKDLVGICMRLALVDAMYQEEKPFLVLDDPFVNFDEETTKGAIALMEAVSEEYQILYVTCHSHRSRS